MAYECPYLCVFLGVSHGSGPVRSLKTERRCHSKDSAHVSSLIDAAQCVWFTSPLEWLGLGSFGIYRLWELWELGFGSFTRGSLASATRFRVSDSERVSIKSASPKDLSTGIRWRPELPAGCPARHGSGEGAAPLRTVSVGFRGFERFSC